MNGKLYSTARYLLGVIFLIFGSNGLMMVLTGKGFLPMPPPKPEAMESMGAFFKIGYLMILVKSLQIISSLFLLSGRFVNLAIIFLGPIIVNILCVHLFIDMSGLPIALLVTVLFIILIKGRWSELNILLKS